MSSRALRKVQRDREEQERLKTLNQDDGEESRNENVLNQSQRQSAFALLGEQEGLSEEEEEEEEENGGQNGMEVRKEPAIAPAPKQAGKKKKKKKKRKVNGAAATESTQEEDREMDDIDKALKQLSTKNGSAQQGATTGETSQAADELSKLLSIDTNHLHAQNEMRRLFGRAALEQQEDGQPPQNANVGGNRRQQRRVQQIGLAQALRGRGGPGGRSAGLAAIAMRRNMFIQGKEEWPIATGGGLGMEIEEKMADGTVLYRFVHNRIYQDVQAQFEMAVESMDPNRLVVLLQHNPYHISTLLQVSEIAKQERDHSTSGDLLERALFSFGRAVHSTFAKALGEGRARLDFRRMENREFWLAAWRYMQNLSMRATWRTVYEWAKLLLSLSPEDDPYALWLVLDQYALRARQDLDFLNIARNRTCKEVHRDMPNIQLSQGLAEFRAGNHSKGRQALYVATGRFPWVVARLMQELDPPPAIWGKEPRTEKEKLYAELYATRAKDLWNTPEASALLMEVASALPPETVSSDVDSEEIKMNEARHVLLSDTPSLIALIPRTYTAQLLSSSDPLQPADSYPSYVAGMTHVSRNAPRAMGSAAEDLSELQGLYGFFSNLFPWFRPTHDDNGEPDAQQPTEDEVERRIRESGVDEELIVDRTRRMMELQQRLRGELVGGNVEFDTGGQMIPGAFGEREPERAEGDLRATVEEATDEGD